MNVSLMMSDEFFFFKNYKIIEKKTRKSINTYLEVEKNGDMSIKEGENQSDGNWGPWLCQVMGRLEREVE